MLESNQPLTTAERTALLSEIAQHFVTKVSLLEIIAIATQATEATSEFGYLCSVYAVQVLKKPAPRLEPYLSLSAKGCLEYMCAFGGFPKGEVCLLQAGHPSLLFEYCRRKRGRWLEAEPTIRKHLEIWQDYKKRFIYGG